MSTPENPPAFPQLLFWPDGKLDINSPGMTLRDYFAAKALQGWIANSPKIQDKNLNGTKEHAKIMANLAYSYADAMLAARNRAGEEGRS